MKTLKELNWRLENVKPFNDKYPHFNMDDRKIHVLFLSPCLNETGYYRMILPALELNRTDTHSAIIAAIHKWDFNKLFDDYDNPLDFRLVKWQITLSFQLCLLMQNISLKVCGKLIMILNS